MTIGERIRQYRKQKDVSLNKLAVLSGVSPAYISQLENNKSGGSPSVEIAQKIAKALEISVLNLLSDTQSEQICGNCRFFGGGEFYRYPPQFTGEKEVVVGYNSDNYRDITESQETWGYPEVAKESFCGEWQPNK